MSHAGWFIQLDLGLSLVIVGAPNVIVSNGRVIAVGSTGRLD